MTHLESEIKSLKAETTDMWKLVLSQMKKTFHSFKTFDKDFSREVVSNEKRVNSMELQIDRDCENILALHTPVAVDLRFVLATLKIINNLERVGDIAEGISLYIISQKEPFDEELLRATKLIEMFEGANNIVEDVLNAFETDDTKLARSIL